MSTHATFRALVGSALALLLTASLGSAQDPRLPDGLRHVPADALGFVHIRAGDFLKSDLGKTLLQEVRKDREASKGLKEIEKTLGVAAEDLESVTVVMLALPSRMLMNQPGFAPHKHYHPHYWAPDVEMKKPIFEDRKFEKEKLELKKAVEQLRLDEEKRRLMEELQRELDKAQRELEEANKRRDKILKVLKLKPILFQDDEAKNKQELEARERQRLEAELQRRLAEERARQAQAELEFQRQRALEMQRQRELDHLQHIHGSDFDDGSATPLVIVTSTKDLDRKKILREQLFASGPRNPFGPSPLDRPTVLFVSDRTVVLGTPAQLAKYSEMRATTPIAQPLKAALELGAEGRLVTAGGHVPAEWRRLVFSPFMPAARELVALAPLLQTDMGMTLDLGKSVDVKLQFKAPTKAAAENALQALKSLRVMGELAIEKSREAGESGGTKLELEKAFLKALANATVEQKDTTVQAAFKFEVGPKVYAKFLKDVVAQLRSKGDRARSMNNLKQIALAMHNYHDAMKYLPPAGISDADGKPLLSWRVAILPYIEQADLYKQFDLNQPWDHPTNKALIGKMPAIYLSPEMDSKPGETHYRVLVGPGTIFEPKKGPGGRAIGTRLFQIPDGTSNTFMVVEATQPTIWTKPDDLPYNPQGPLPKFGVTPDGFLVAFADGSVRFVRAGVREEVLRVYLTGNNGIPRQPLD